MIKNITFLLLFTLTIYSCGKSKAEIELEKAKVELENTKIELENKAKKEEELKVHEQKANVGKSKKITELNSQLQRIPGALKKAQENINKIKTFKIGRSSKTKEEQLRKAYNQLNEIRLHEDRLKNEIAQLEYLKTFDFQKSPEGVMNYIFESAKKRDFSNFRHLCDPYGENDSDVDQLCYAEMLSVKRKENLKRDFENARVISSTQIESDKAEVEFAYGRSSNRLEKMKMVKRNELWYLSSF